MPRQYASHGEPVLALVAVEPRLLAGDQVDLVGQIVLDDRRPGSTGTRADEHDILPVEALLRGDGPVGPGDDALGPGEVEQVPEQELSRGRWRARLENWATSQRS